MSNMLKDVAGPIKHSFAYSNIETRILTPLNYFNPPSAANSA